MPQLVTCSNLEIYGITEMAVRLGPPGLGNDEDIRRKTAWIPNSQIDERDAYDVGDIGEFVMPKWLADKNDLEFTE